jgi:anaerobic ribonucleoside-triphosphate reductase activating protein
MRFVSCRLVFQEVPDEISLAFLIAGCPVGCAGCHSAASWNADRGEELSAAKLESLLLRHQRVVTCVVFLGGEWSEADLAARLDEVRARGLKTCLYTGLEEEQVSDVLKSRLDFLKVGPFRAERGGLQDPGTNQKFIDLRNKEVLNHRFQRQGGRNGQTNGSTNRGENPLHP